MPDTTRSAGHHLIAEKPKAELQGYHDAGSVSSAETGGAVLLEMVRWAERLLATDVALVNGLNVFPVPDGDTGTNMLATTRAALAQAAGACTLAEAGHKLGDGALLGAKGNSGVILAQLFRALKEVLPRRPELTGETLAEVFERASALGRATVTQPVEGTLLTVMDSVAQCTASQAPKTLTGVVCTAVDAAEAALARTPDQLPLLKEAQVVDAGGYGLLLLLCGWRQALTGQEPAIAEQHLLGVASVRERLLAGRVHPAELVSRPAEGYGYCISALIEAGQCDAAAVQRALEGLGSSVLLAVSEGKLKLHVHAPDPRPILDYASGLGSLLSQEISNIDEQAAAGAGTGVGVLAIVPGDGFASLFRSLGAAATLPGGAGHNPSVADILAAVRALGMERTVFVLPNNANILAAVVQAAGTQPSLHPVPSKTVPQGIAAMLAFNEGASDAENARRMGAAMEAVISGELVPASRAATMRGISVQPGDMLALVEGELAGAGATALEALMDQAAAGERELATIYYGAAVTRAEAEDLKRRMLQIAPNLEVEIVRGDQPLSHFIISLE